MNGWIVYILLDGLVRSIVGYIYETLYFGEPLGRLKIQEKSREV